MDFTYHFGNCYLEVYVGKLNKEVIVSGEENDLYYEENWYDFFKQNNTPVLFVINKTDIYDENVEELKIKFEQYNKKTIIIFLAIILGIAGLNVGAIHIDRSDIYR